MSGSGRSGAVPSGTAEKPPCRECGGIGYYQTEGPGEGGVVLMNCHVCSDGQVIPEPSPSAAPLEPGIVTFLVGTSYNGQPPNHWQVWHKPYDEIIETLRKRQGDVKPDGSRYLIVEVQIRDTTVIASEVTVA